MSRTISSCYNRLLPQVRQTAGVTYNLFMLQPAPVKQRFYSTYERRRLNAQPMFNLPCTPHSLNEVELFVDLFGFLMYSLNSMRVDKANGWQRKFNVQRSSKEVWRFDSLVHRLKMQMSCLHISMTQTCLTPACTNVCLLTEIVILQHYLLGPGFRLCWILHTVCIILNILTDIIRGAFKKYYSRI